MSRFFTPPPQPLHLSPPPPWYWSPPPPPPPPAKSHETLVVIAYFLVPGLFLFIIFLIFSGNIRAPTNNPTPAPATTTTSAGTRAISAEPQRERSRQGGLDIATIQMFPVLLNSDVRQLKEIQRQIECVICMSEFEDDEILRMLPGCCHVFHLDCIGTWLALRVTCPVCRINLKEIDIKHA